MAQDLYQRLVDVIEKLSIAGYGSPESIEKMRTRPDVDFNGFVANSLTTKVKAEEVTKLLDRVDKLVPLRTTAVAPSVATVSVEDRIRQLEEQVATLMQKLGAAQ
jgi:hypothetical protein